MPLGLAVLTLRPVLLRVVPVSRGKIGAVDSALVTGAIVAAVYGIATAERVGWFVPQTLGLLAWAIGLFAAFLIQQAMSRGPLLPLRPFRAPGLAAGNLVMALLGAACIPLWFFLNLYLQSVLQLSVFGSGLALLPMTLVIMVFMVKFTGPVISRFGMKPVMVTGLITLSGALGLPSMISGEGTYLASVLPASLIAALGMSLAYIPVTISGKAGAAPEDTGLASGLINLTYQVGSALGLAVMVSVAVSTSLGDAQQAIEPLSGCRAAFLGAALVGVVASVVSLVFVRGSGKAAEVLVG